MPARIERLRSTIRELENELRQVSAVDERTRDDLQQVVREIQSALDEPTVVPPESLTSRLRENLEEAEREFQASHPTISGLILRIVDTLGQLGI